MKTLVAWLLLLAAGSAAAQTAAPPAGAATDLEPVPRPELGALEPQVATQLRQTRELLDAVLERPDAAAAELADAYGELGRTYHAYRLEAPAAAAYRNAARLAPADPRWPYYLAYLHQQTGRFEEAVELYGRVLELAPGDLAARVHLGESHLALGRPEEAEAHFRAALAADPELAAAHAGLGQVALSRRDHRAAVEHLHRALELLPQADRLHYPLAQAYRGLGDLDAARRHLERTGSVGARPPDPWIEELTELARGERVHLLRGRLAYRAGALGEAAEAFRQAVAAAPDSARARVNLGSALGSLGQVEEAVAEYRRALELEPDNATARFNLAALLAGQGRHEEAVEHLAEVARLAPGDAEARLRLAEGLERLGRAAEALPHYTAAVELAPGDPRGRVGEASALALLGRYREAREHLEKAHAALPVDGSIAHALARLLAAGPDPALRDGERALDLARRVFEAVPSVAHAETVALALAESGRCDEAAAWQEQAAAAARAAGERALASRLIEILKYYKNNSLCRPPLNPDRHKKGIDAPPP